MIADELTKSLSSRQFKRFVKQLDMTRYQRFYQSETIIKIIIRDVKWDQKDDQNEIFSVSRPSMTE